MIKNHNVIIVHGAYGYPTENWFGWLKKKLEDRGIECHVPCLPTPESQSLDLWLEIFNREIKDLIHENTILIGHSLGAAFILRWLELNECKVLSVILVGAFIGKVGVACFDVINQSFFETPFDWKCLKQRNRNYICYYGTDDEYVSRHQFNLISKKLNAKKIIVSKAKHFNTASGYDKFPQLLLQLLLLRQKS